MIKRIVYCWMLMTLVIAPGAFALNVGDTAPDFTGTTLDGESVSLSGLKGQVVVLKLATTWCPTCKEQMQELGKAAEFLKANNIPVVEVFFQESAGTVKSYLKKYTINYDLKAMTDEGEIFGAYNVYLIPRLLVIDKNGNVARDGGVMKADNMQILLEKLLERPD